MNLINILISLLGIMGSRQGIWATKESGDISNAEGKKKIKEKSLGNTAFERVILKNE